EVREAEALRGLQEPPPWASAAWIGAALAAAGASLLALFVLPYSDLAPYADAMRWVASPCLAYAAAAAFARDAWEFGLGWGLLSLALNPVLPMPMALDDWRAFNAVTPVLLAGMWVLLARRRR
ncbi:MAG: hypothetical protein KGL53_07170, partial [Elusimicrobia bacterium]|nr:hypothetical protein [Elusimicrobiota bacterium]